MNIELTGRAALVTGGNVGIGRAIALALAGAGADVAVTYLTHDDEQTVAAIRALGRRATALRLDVTDSDEVARATERAAQELGGHLDILVANAGGLVERRPIAEMDDALWRRVMAVNLDSAFYCARAVLPHMASGWGRIVLMSSVAARHGGGAGAAAYATAKAGLLGLTRGLAKELGPRGITVNAIAPGVVVDTPFHETFTPPEQLRAMVGAIPLGRAGEPEDVAAAALYLASDLGAWISGAVIDLNGGTYFA